MQMWRGVWAYAFCVPKLYGSGQADYSTHPPKKLGYSLAIDLRSVRSPLPCI